MVQTPESKIKSDIKKYLKSIGALSIMIPQGAYCTPGAPDMIILYDSHTWYTEVKTPTGKLREDQLIMKRKIADRGGD